MSKYDPATIARALEAAKDIGIAEAASRHGVTLNLLHYHKKKRGIFVARKRRGSNSARKPEIDRDLAILRAVTPDHVTFTPSEIAEIIGGVSRQRIYEIEHKALLKFRHALIHAGIWQEAS